jgi:glycerate 2-kinase
MENKFHHIKQIYTAAIDSVNPETAVKNICSVSGDKLTVSSHNESRSYNLTQYRRIFVVGAGKATALMAKAIENLLVEKITDGIICVKYNHTVPLTKIKTIEASHPVPDNNGIQASKEIKNLLYSAQSTDLVISLISGGGSSLLPLPVDDITLEEKIKTTNALLNCGASIHEINAVRKHISLTKGGQLARTAYPATVINIMISDVVGDDVDVIASGPFVPDTSTYEQALLVLKKYNLISQIPLNVLNHLNAGSSNNREETPKINDVYFDTVFNTIALSNYTSLLYAKEKAESLGYNTIILSSFLEGDTTESVLFHTAIAREIQSSGNPVQTPACILSGGENTVKIKGSGKGGRNTEFALRSAEILKNHSNIIAASVASDGTDGPTDAAGAIVDCDTWNNAISNNIEIEDYMNNNDSYTFFERTTSLIKTGPTNTNVMDIHILLIT